jgi:putative oxidoreductase
MPLFLRPFHSQVYALMRIGVGLLFMCRGSQKLFGFPGSPPATPAFIAYIAGTIELVGGLLVAVGLFAGWRLSSAAA